MPRRKVDADGAEAEEHRRIRQVYAGYDAEQRCRSIWADTPGSRYMLEGKWRKIAGALAAHRASLQGSWCLDLGSGSTGDAVRLGAYESALRGIVALDLLHAPLARARRVNPGLLAIAADASRMPLPDRSIGVVYQSTMLSSVLDPALRAAILAEIRRVLKEGGVFISYDTRYPNPWNRHTRPVPSRELERAFAGWPHTMVSLTGIPQLIRLLAPISTIACRFVEAVPLLRSHLLFVGCRPTLGR
jgi:ubiquinone/menaquinone biosynthesis C-methylase UbiE